MQKNKELRKKENITTDRKKGRPSERFEQILCSSFQSNQTLFINDSTTVQF